MLRQTGPQIAAATVPRPPATSSVPAVNSLFDSVELAGVAMPFDRNAEIFGEGEPADYVYKVLSGSVRTYRVLTDGRRQISAFHLPGEVFGLESGEEHSCSAEAISQSSVLVVKRSTVLAAAEREGDVARQLWGITARELGRAQNHSMLLIKSAQERVASFLLEMARRFSGGSAVELPMTRQDIADYLGLTIETVSRTLTQLQGTATIELPASRRVVLRNRSALTRLDA
jgi:CRP/FNR family transcriptional regulator, nitrogen fixation regulation protein